MLIWIILSSIEDYKDYNGYDELINFIKKTCITIIKLSGVELETKEEN